MILNLGDVDYSIGRHKVPATKPLLLSPMGGQKGKTD